MIAGAALSRVGAVLDAKYKLVRRVGSGGMSEVYEAEHLQLGRRVAIKFLLPDLAARPELIARFRNEARAAGSLRHENIAAVNDVGELPDGMQYLVMELLSGMDCSAALKLQTRFEVARAVELGVQLCRGLSVAHAHDIVHRDLKPANLFLSPRGDSSEQLKILDFGIAKLRQNPDAELSTGTGAALGTPCYMAPEQARGERDIDARADIYAAGVILYEMLSGQRPFDGDSTLQVLHRIQTQAFVPLDTLCNDLPAGLCNVVHRALERDREKRYASAPQLMAALQAFASGPVAAASDNRHAAGLAETQPDPDPESKQRQRNIPRLTLSTRAPRAARHTGKLAGLVLGLASLLAGAAWLWEPGQAPSKLPAQPVAPTGGAEASLVAQPRPLFEQIAVRPDAGSDATPQPSAASVDPAIRAQPSEPHTRPVKRAARRMPSGLSALPPPPAPEAHAPEAPPAAAPRPSVPGRLTIDHKNPYQ